MGGESEIKIGNIVNGNFKGRVVRIEKAIGFNSSATVVIECKLKMEELKNVINKKSSGRTSGKKKKASCRKG